MIYLSSLIGKMRQQFRNITEFAHQMKSCDFQTVTLSILHNRLVIFIYLLIYSFFFYNHFYVLCLFHLRLNPIAAIYASRNTLTY